MSSSVPLQPPKRTLRQLFIGSSVVLFMVVLLLSGLMWWQISRLTNTLLDFQAANRRAEVSLKIRQNSSDLITTIKTLLPYQNKTAFEQGVSALQVSLSENEATLAVLLSEARPDEAAYPLMVRVSERVDNTLGILNTMLNQAKLERWSSVSVRVAVLVRDREQVAEDTTKLVELTRELEQVSLQQVTSTWRAALIYPAVVLLLVVGVSGLIAWWMNQVIIQPISLLTEMATQIAGGNLTHRVAINNPTEIGVLAESFNLMTQRLADLVDNLEQRVAERTLALSTGAELSYRLTGILNLADLLAEVTNRLQQELHFYYVGICLVDERGEGIYLAEGTGEAGMVIKQSRAVLSLQAAQSLIVKAARTRQVVIVDDVLQSEDWLAHALLPETRSEVAVPIVVNEQLVGVLDVQANEVAAFGLSEVNLLQTLANQLGVAINNARLYSLAQQEIADRKRAEWALAQVNVELAQSNADKDRFFSIVAHDLKGPFMPLLGNAELLTEMGDILPPVEVKQIGASIYRTAKNTLNLLENLLQWARLQMGRMEYNPQRLDVAEVAARTVELLLGNALAKEITLRSEVQAGVWVYADENMLDTVIRNLTNNALKFTPKGGQVKIISSLSSEVENPLNTPTPAYVEVAIVDTGVGMPPEVKEKLFKLDQHVTTVGTGKETGTGLGLIICQEMVVKSGGKIWVESEVGQGTTVKFTVRLDKS